MTSDGALLDRFEADRRHLREVAFRILGSLDDADDAVQQAWLKASAADLTAVDNLTGWLTTVTARTSLDLLRARARRRELPLDEPPVLERLAGEAPAADEEVALVEEVGRALLMVLARLSPRERVALVLHDAFGVPFEEVAAIVDRSPAAAKKLASRARRKVGAGERPSSGLREQRRLVEAFLAAARQGDVDGLVAVLAPDVVRRADPQVLPTGAAREARGVAEVAAEVRVLGGGAAVAECLLVDGAVGAVVAPRGRLLLALLFEVADGRITAFEVVADADRLRRLRLALLPTSD